MTGDWVAQSEATPGFSAGGLAGAGQPLGFDAAGLGRWDTGLIAFLWEAERAASAAGIVLDPSGLPGPARKLLGLLCLPGCLPRPLHPGARSSRWTWLADGPSDCLRN